MAVIDVRGIGKRYGAVTVLRGVDLDVQPGTVLGLLGPNGAGKTTLIKILTGLLKPDEGGRRVLGFDLLREHHRIRGSVSLVATTAEVGTDNNLTVRQNLEFWSLVHGLRGGEARRRIDELLGELDLASKADAWPMHISAGQRQRLSLARSLLARNALVFLDEPTNRLDFEGVRSVRSLVARMNREDGVTFVLTTHVMEEAEELCSRIALLDDGALVACAPTAELVSSLGIARPMDVLLRAGDVPLDELSRLPGVRRVDGIHAEGDAVRVRLESDDLRATTPALLQWTRISGAELVSISAQPVTLRDAFASLRGRANS